MQSLTSLSSAASNSQAGTVPIMPRPPASNTGQRARVTHLLRERGSQGLASIQAIQFGILRLPNRISELRKQGFEITGRAAPSGVMTYRLVSEPSSVLPLRSYSRKPRQSELSLFARTPR